MTPRIFPIALDLSHVGNRRLHIAHEGTAILSSVTDFAASEAIAASDFPLPTASQIFRIEKIPNSPIILGIKGIPSSSDA